jgi:nucleotide-binding universal stress UspA family protein
LLNIENILFPVDLSEPCRAAAPFVRWLACRTGARVTMLHVLEMPQPYYSDLTSFLSLVDMGEMLRLRKAPFDAFLAGEFQDLRFVRRILRFGDPVQLILEYARKLRVGMIMMPTHGMGTFRRLILGSVTAKVLHDAECPVWTDAHIESAGAEHVHPGRCSKILCGLNLQEDAARVLKYAAELAQILGAELRLLHAVPASESLTTKYFDTELVTALTETAGAKIAELQSAAGTSAQVVIRGGEPAHVIRDAAIESQADLVVIGRGVLTEKLGRLRTQCYAIIRDSPCPVWSV